MELFSVNKVVCSCSRKLKMVMSLLNKREERMALKDGGGIYKNNTCYLCTKNTE